MTVDTEALNNAGQRISEFRRGWLESTSQILRKHGAKIERNAAPLTPVDKGFLRRANTSKVEAGAHNVTLTVENRMVYAAYQHYRTDLRHRVGRDHFISIPFGEELDPIKRDIVKAGMEVLQK